MSAENSIPVVILCGGKGTRLGNLSKKVPKPLVPVGGMPIVWHIMKSYAQYGYKNFVLCLGYKAELFHEYFDKGTLAGESMGDHPPKDPDWNVTCVDTGLETGTSGRVFRVKEHIQDSPRSFLTYGDGVCSVSIPELLEFHTARGKLATMTGVHPPTSFGIVEHEDGIVTAFKEKPRLNVIINGGFFVLESAALDYLDDDGPFERRPLVRLTEASQLAVYHHDGFWQCMDTQKERAELDAMWQRQERPWAPWAEDLDGVPPSVVHKENG